MAQGGGVLVLGVGTGPRRGRALGGAAPGPAVDAAAGEGAVAGAAHVVVVPVHFAGGIALVAGAAAHRVRVPSQVPEVAWGMCAGGRFGLEMGLGGEGGSGTSLPDKTHAK